MRIFKKPLWITLSSVFTLLFIGLLIGGLVANDHKSAINWYFNLKDYTLETIVPEDGKEIDSEYFKSKYIQKDADGNIIYRTEENEKKGYKHQVYDNISLVEAGKARARQVQREGATILWNTALGATTPGLPLAKGNSVSLFGRSSIQYVNSGDGSGNSIFFYTINVKNYLENEELKVNNTLWSFYKNGDGSGYKPTDYEKPNEVPWSKYNSAVTNSFSQYNDAAIVFLSRRAGEFKDVNTETAGTVSGDYTGLSQEEKDLIENVIKYKQNGVFKKIIILLNTARGLNFNDLMPYRSDVDTCMWVGQCGSYGMYEIADILVGDSIPSGHLPDTYVYNGKSAPAYVNSSWSDYSNAGLFGITGDELVRKGRYIAYAENIYVGYKYYETRYEDAVLNKGNATSSAGAVESKSNWKYSEEVAFPFGYGESYTKFEYSNFSVLKNEDNDYIAKVTVKNVGGNVGADAVQFYIQRPYTEFDKLNGIEQASVNLCGFVKTKELQPNEIVNLEFRIEDDAFKTYDDAFHDTYIREKTVGNERYYITVAEDAHQAINNILAKKGKTPGNTNGVMDAAGNEKLVNEFQFSTDDVETFTKSKNGSEITNRFTDVDWNKYTNKGKEIITYLSRSDWNKTYPKEKVKLSLTTYAVEDLAYDHEIQYTNEEYPLYNQEHKYNLIDMRGLDYNADEWEVLLNQLTLDEQVKVIGNALYGTSGINSIANPGELVEDGPLGVRKKYTENAGESDRTTSFPIIPLLGASFNEELALEVGRVMGEDILQSGASGIYAPSANIHRTQYGGRMYEYYSEDGFLSGRLCNQQTIGIQESGSSVTLKHFALNEQESNRQGVGIWANEQSIREIYLEPFRYAIEEGKAKSVMSSFTRFGTAWSGACSSLNNGVLRDEWGFNGFVISDCPYFDYMGILDGLEGGNDSFLYELSDTKLANYYKAETNPRIAQLIRQSVHRVLFVVANGNCMNGYTSFTQQVPVTNWWEYTIVGLQIMFGLLSLASIVLLILCFIKKENKINDKEVVTMGNVQNNNPEYKEKNSSEIGLSQEKMIALLVKDSEKIKFQIKELNSKVEVITELINMLEKNKEEK